MFGREARERAEAEARAQTQRADAAERRATGAEARAERAEAKAADLSHKYEQPVTTGRVIPTATETNRRRH